MDINTHVFWSSQCNKLQQNRCDLSVIIILVMAVICASNVFGDVVNKGCEFMDTFFGKFLALFKEIQKNKEGLWRIKGITMAQWTNVNRNNRFVNPPPLPWLSEISGALHLALPGLTAEGRQADEIQVNFKNLKTHCRSKHSSFRFVSPRYSIITAIPMHSKRFFG